MQKKKEKNKFFVTDTHTNDANICNAVKYDVSKWSNWYIYSLVGWWKANKADRPPHITESMRIEPKCAVL